MKFKMSFLAAMALTLVFFSSCTSVNKSMREPYTRVELNLEDFTLSQQLTAEATTTKYLNIDFARLFSKNTGTLTGTSALSLASIPVVGNVVVDQTVNYALFELMQANPGYDVVFYPSYETTVKKPIIGIGAFTKITTVKVTARLGKLK